VRNFRDFVHLHLHSDRSALDSIIKPKQLARRVKELGMPAVAVTDHGVAAASIALYKACKEEKKPKGDNLEWNDIWESRTKPIIGMESYLAPTDDHTLREILEGHPKQQCYHLTLLARNSKGVSQLFKLSSIGFLEGYYYKPRVSLKLVEEIGHDLIVMGACAKGPVSWNLLNDNRKQAAKYLARLRDSFEGRFYLEVMDHRIPFQDPLNQELIRLAELYETPWIPTNDAHFLIREDHHEHSLMMCLQLKKTLPELSAAGMRYPQECYVKTPAEMCSHWGEQACFRTVEVAEQIEEYDLIPDKPLFPRYEENGKGE